MRTSRCAFMQSILVYPLAFPGRCDFLGCLGCSEAKV